MKTLVIHHNADFDGLFCLEIAKLFLTRDMSPNDSVDFIGWDFKDKPISLERLKGFDCIYIMDLPVDRVFGFDYRSPESVIAAFNGADGHTQFCKRVIWIDHHVSSIETHPQELKGYRIDGVAACRLAWQWFTIVDGNTPRTGAEIGIPIRPAGVLPMIQDYKNREVMEPAAVRLAGEYDVFDHRDERVEWFQCGLKGEDLEATGAWVQMLAMDITGNNRTREICYHGIPVKYARDQEYATVIKSQGFMLVYEGVIFLACNSHVCDMRSQLFTAGLPGHEPEYEALLGFTYLGKGEWKISMYRIPGKSVDILAIAKKHKGGGGHAGACGFTSKGLPFEL